MRQQGNRYEYRIKLDQNMQEKDFFRIHHNYSLCFCNYYECDSTQGQFCGYFHRWPRGQSPYGWNNRYFLSCDHRWGIEHNYHWNNKNIRTSGGVEIFIFYLLYNRYWIIDCFMLFLRKRHKGNLGRMAHQCHFVAAFKFETDHLSGLRLNFYSDAWPLQNNKNLDTQVEDGDRLGIMKGWWFLDNY